MPMRNLSDGNKSTEYILQQSAHEYAVSKSNRTVLCWLQHNVWCQTRVATNIKSYYQIAVFTHFHGHSSNLAASDSMKTSRIMKDALATTH